MKALVISAIVIYRNFLSIFMLDSCRLIPTCSEYAIEAIQRHGLAGGIWRAVLRILRCNPFYRNRFDSLE